MIELEEYKMALGESLIEKLTEEEILKVREQQDKMVEICWSIWLDGLLKRSTMQMQCL